MGSKYSAMMHLEATKTTTAKEAYYSAYSSEQKVNQRFRYTVESYTKTPKLNKQTTLFNPLENEVFKTHNPVKEAFVVKEIEPTNRIKQLFTIFLEAGKSIKGRLKTFFRILRKRN
ncbi:MAG: hypothetical protein ACJA1C_000094 [Crocinitomicaceae bacterium]|jgi:hypothetical protein